VRNLMHDQVALQTAGADERVALDRRWSDLLDCEGRHRSAFGHAAAAG
jgi:hypothetical protein